MCLVYDRHVTNSRRPRFSIVTAVYGVAPYLPDFIRSIEAQTHDLADIEVIAVDDGSVDGSRAILEAWRDRRPELVTVITQANAGQGPARDAGTDAARGEWVTYTDPDDVLEPDYFEVVDRFLAEHPDTDMATTNRLLWNEGDGAVTNSHPLRPFFRNDRLVDIDVEGDYFHGSAPAAFFRLDILREQGRRFDHRIRPNFEDGHFTTRYLLDLPRRRVAFLGSAHYHYRKRAAADSTLSGSRSRPTRYGDVVEFGYLDLVDAALERFGTVPRWLKSYLVYELSGYFAMPDSTVVGRLPFDDPQVVERFHALVAQILAKADLGEVLEHALIPPNPLAKLVLAHAYDDAPWHEAEAVVEQHDRKQRLARVGYFFTGERPEERFVSNGEAVAPLHAKDRVYLYAGRPLLHERIAWISANHNVSLELDGRLTPLVFERPEHRRGILPSGAINQRLHQRPRTLAALPNPFEAPTPTTKEGRRAAVLASKDKYAERYRRAWVCMDRLHDAGDSGEVFFKYLRREQPQVNAWFVQQKDTADWNRLRAEGFGDRLVAHGSVEWRVLMAHAAHLVSSHTDLAITNPAAVEEFALPRWRFTFLQHGVIKDDLSSWLNKRPIDTFVTSTPQELASIAGDGTTYRYTTREARLTGLPRFDRLREIGQRHPAERRDLLLVTPTWRRELSPELEPGTQRRIHDMDAVRSSAFVEQWWRFLSDPRLHDAASRHGLRIGLLPHPNLQPVLPELDLPAGIDLLTYEGDVQQLFARARVLVTDFSSIAFNAAYLDRPVVYFQFDRDAVLHGDHVGRAGYFDYELDGFGPVALTADDAVGAATAALDAGADPVEPYRSRIDRTFPQRDGQCCARVFEAIRDSERSRVGDAPQPTPVMPPRDDVAGAGQ